MMVMASRRKKLFLFHLLPIGLAVLLMTVFICSSQKVQAATFDELVGQILQTDPRILQAEAADEVNRLGTKTAYAKLLPTVDVSGHYGYEEIINEAAADTYFETRKLQLKATQLLYDFQKTPLGIKQAKTNKEVSELAKESIRQVVVLDALTAYFNLAKTSQQLKYAQTSEDNIQQQTGMEEARVQKGSGLATDVLQTKSQLAGAMAVRVRAEGALTVAINNYRKVFRTDPEDLNEIKLPNVPYQQLPQTLQEVVDSAMANNLTLKQAAKSVELARTSRKTAVANFFPEFKLIGQSQFKEDEAGTEFRKDEHVVKVDFSYPLFKSGANVYALRSASQGLISAQESLTDIQRTIEEVARNSWQNLLTSRINAQYLRNQANISGEFLELARRERKLGKRSLLDVLNGETNYINATSSAVAAETDMALAVFNLFFVMGRLDLDLVQGKKEETSPSEPPSSGSTEPAPDAS